MANYQNVRLRILCWPIEALESQSFRKKSSPFEPANFAPDFLIERINFTCLFLPLANLFDYVHTGDYKAHAQGQLQ